jgi:hypothetical protein
MNPALVGRGYGENSGMLSPDRKKFIVNIPKNASSYILDWTRAHAWITATLDNNWPDVEEIIVVLRDPLNRWISGMSQYLKSYILCPVGPNGPVFPGMTEGTEDYAMSADNFITAYNQTTERLIFDNVYRFDDHVWPQKDFVQNLRPHVPRTYFMIDKEFDAKFGSYLNLTQLPNLDRNDGSDNLDTKKLNEFLRHRLNTRPELVDRVKRAYSADYEFIKNVQPR